MIYFGKLARLEGNKIDERIKTAKNHTHCVKIRVCRLKKPSFYSRSRRPVIVASISHNNLPV